MTNAPALLKTILLPPLLALALYLLSTYVLLPLFRRYRERASYTALPTSLTSASLPPTAAGLISALVHKLSALMLRASNSTHRTGHQERENGFGDEEELEEGLNRTRHGEGGEGRRLSRELERGFRDDSDTDSDA